MTRSSNCLLNLVMLFIISFFFLYVYLKKKEAFECSLNQSKYNRNYYETCSKYEVNKIVTFIIDNINRDLGSSFMVINYGDILSQTYPDLSKRYIINVFLNEKKHFLVKKVIIDVINIKNSGTLKLLSLKLGNSLDTIMEHPKSSRNLIENQFSELGVLDGSSSDTLEYVFLDKEDKLKYKNNCNFNNWIANPELECVRKEEPKPFPCRKLGKWWNNDGIKDLEEPNMNCIGINSATVDRNLSASFNPTILDNKIKIVY